jgi:ABC-type bacteriocin/lantibiotic exporters, contain an N-terminal double-glycine peptidase domain
MQCGVSCLQMGDLLQRMNDHERVEKFLTTQVLTVMFSLLTFIVFACVLMVYNTLIFGTFLFGSLLYGIWLAFFLKNAKCLITCFSRSK